MLEIKPAGGTDAGVVASLIRESFAKQVQALGLSETGHPNYVGFETEGRVQRRLASGCQVAVAFIADLAVGTVSCGYPDGGRTSGEIMRLAVLPAHRGNGYGRELMQYAETQLVSAGARVAEISIVAQFGRLRSYYEGLGYRVTTHKTLPSLPFELLFMQKELARRH